ncbi:MAG: glycogen/starch synthase [Candidatus Gastranaerophilales bacterium]|nr:glycogen/starch synthase [Candidatus Gastranaerophilales bacterium]
MAQTQVNSPQVVPSAPVQMSVPQQDVYTPSAVAAKPENNVLANILKYSGIAALAALPVVFIVSRRGGGAAQSKMMTELQSSVSELSQKVTTLSSEITSSKTIQQEAQKVAQGASDKFQYLLTLLLAGGTGIAVEKTIKDLKDKVPQQDQKDIETASNNIFKTRQPVTIKNISVQDSKTRQEIWGGFTLDLNNAGKVKSSTISQIKKDIQTVMAGETAMTAMKNPTIWSVCYEGWGTIVGGQADIANEVPVEFNKRGINTVAIAPLFTSEKDSAINFALLPIEGEPNKFKYNSQKFNNTNAPTLEKIYDGKMDDGSYMQVYAADVPVKAKEGEPQTQKVLYLHDDGDFFDLGLIPKVKDINIYTAKAHEERTRIAKFNKMTYELISKVKNGEIKLPDGVELKAPDKIIGHEAWQTFGLLATMRMLSRAEEFDGIKTKEQGEYLRNLANNTLTIIHNIGEGYQGRNWNEPETSQFFNVLYGKYAKDLVSNLFLDDVKGEKFYGTPLQRVGLAANHLNAAQGALALATKVGPVSAGYKKEIIENKMSGELDPMMVLRNKNDGVVAMPNGVNREKLVFTDQNVNEINKAISKEIASGMVEPVKAHAKTAEEIDNLNPQNADMIKKFMEEKKHNKKVFITLLKDLIDRAKAPEAKDVRSPLLGGPAIFHGDVKLINLEGVNEDTPVFTMASRMDAQKGFDTMAETFKNIYENYEMYGLKEKPVLITSGGGHAELDAHMAKVKESLGEAGNRMVFLSQRMSEAGLMLMSNASTIAMPSDFEPYGISDIKGMYAGSHVVGNAVGGMIPTPGVSRKMYDYNNSQDKDRANSLLVPNDQYIPMCTVSDDKKAEVRRSNANKLTKYVVQSIKLSPEERARLDLNALKTNVSWDKGALDNYINVLKIEK